jgi:RNA polymerase sigma-70 factor (ECF subfamily)
VIGALAIARFFRETAAGGDLRRFRLTPTSANGRPAVAIHHWTDDRGFVPHGISVLEIEGRQIVGIDTYIDPALPPRFGFPHRRRERALAVAAVRTPSARLIA